MKPQQIDELFNTLERLKSEYADKGFDIIVMQTKQEALNRQRRDWRPPEMTFEKCHIGMVMPAIGADGNIYPCCHIGYGVLGSIGHISEGSFLEVWNSPNRARLMQKMPKKHCLLCTGGNARVNYFMNFLAKEVEENPGFLDWIEQEYIPKVLSGQIGKGIRAEDHESIVNPAVKKGMEEGRFVRVKKEDGEFVVTYGKRASRKKYNPQPLVEALGITFDQYGDDAEVLRWLKTTAHIFITPEGGNLNKAPPFLWYEDANRYLIGHAGRGLKHAEQNSYLPYVLIYQLVTLLHKTTDTEEAKRIKSLIARIIRHEARHAWEKRFGNPKWEDEAEIREIIEEIEHYLGTVVRSPGEGLGAGGSVIELKIDGRMQRFRIIGEIEEQRIWLTEDVESRRKFAFRPLISEKDEKHSFWVSLLGKDS
jgi:radical SAM protein with 4Fe4S-binding SPASM domain